VLLEISSPTFDKRHVGHNVTNCDIDQHIVTNTTHQEINDDTHQENNKNWSTRKKQDLDWKC